VNLRRLPLWIRWLLPGAALWCVWVAAVHPYFRHRISATDQQHFEADRQLSAVKEHIGEAPTILHRIDSCRQLLDAHLGGFSSRGDVDVLTRQLRTAGERHGLGDLRAEPELMGLLHLVRSAPSTRPSQVRLDTILVNLTARGRFLSLGAWLDEIEHRPDFRTWIACHWHHGDEGEGVEFEGKVILLVAERCEPLAGPVIGGL